MLSSPNVLVALYDPFIAYKTITWKMIEIKIFSDITEFIGPSIFLEFNAPMKYILIRYASIHLLMVI